MDYRLDFIVEARSCYDGYGSRFVGWGCFGGATADGRTVRWRFFQSAEPRVEMPDAQQYVIYYAYTELYFDRPADLWVAVGSDDRSDIWINNMKIWQSSDELKGWEIGEGLRKVHFRGGFNKVLYRIENGWGRMGFSMTIRTKRGK